MTADACNSPRNVGPKARPLVVLAGALIAAAVGSVIAFQAIGSRFDEKGVLREPFFLLPSSVVLASAGVASLVAAGLTKRKQR